MNWRRLLFYLVLNAAVSAAVTFSVLMIWDYTHRAPVALPTASAVPQPGLSKTPAPFTTVPAPTVTPTVYVVQPGDTLGSIALKYDVSVEAIMQANGLADPNTLSVGLSLVIPVAGQLLPTPTPQSPGPTQGPAITPPPTGTAISQSGEPQLAIRTITDAGNLSTERVTIVNLGAVVDLTGWTLSDEQGNVYTFPALSLFQGGAVSVHTALGRDTVTDLFWGRAGPAWQSGETASLKDQHGKVRATFTAP